MKCRKGRREKKGGKSFVIQLATADKRSDAMADLTAAVINRLASRWRPPPNQLLARLRPAWSPASIRTEINNIHIRC